MKEKLKKCPWKVIVSVAVFVVTLALNIWLLCMPVFKGSPYKGKTDDGSVKTTFYDTTYITDYGDDLGYGFYLASKKSVRLGGYTTYNTGYMLRNPYSATYKRESVFLITSGESSNKIDCYNAGAIVLQCFYGVVLIVSVVCIFGFSSEFIKWKNSFFLVSSK